MKTRTYQGRIVGYDLFTLEAGDEIDVARKLVDIHADLLIGRETVEALVREVSARDWTRIEVMLGLSQSYSSTLPQTGEPRQRFPRFRSARRVETDLPLFGGQR